MYVQGEQKSLFPQMRSFKWLTFIKDSLGFDHAESVSGTDYPNDNQIEVIYHLSSYSDEKLSSQILALIHKGRQK